MWRFYSLLVLSLAPHAVTGGVHGAAAELCKPHATATSLREFKAQRCGVDVSGTLVKAALKYSAELHRSEDPNGHFSIVHAFLHLLIGAIGAKFLVIVCDGGRFPLKTGEHSRRAKDAAAAQQKARAEDDKAAIGGADAGSCMAAEGRRKWASISSSNAHRQMRRKRSRILTIACVSSCSCFRLLVISTVVTTVHGYDVCNNDCPIGNGIFDLCQDGGPGSEFGACELCVPARPARRGSSTPPTPSCISSFT